jgi:hypothetical protein
MSLFAVLATTDDPRIAAALGSVYPADFLRVGPGQYLLSAKGTAIDVSNTLGISNGTNGTGIVISIAGYFGHAATNIWEWLRVKGSAG